MQVLHFIGFLMDSIQKRQMNVLKMLVVIVILSGNIVIWCITSINELYQKP